MFYFEFLTFKFMFIKYFFLRLALLTANKGDYLKALKILENRLNFLQNGIDTILIIRFI